MALGRQLLPEVRESIENFRRFLELDERRELGLDVAPAEVRALPDDDALDVEPVLRTIGEGLEDDEILGRAGAEVDVRRKSEETRTGNSSNGNPPSAMSSPTPDEARSRRTRLVRAKAAASGRLGSKCLKSVST
jgi:hypothetical protein